MAAAGDVSPPVHGPVELVPSVRGGWKAKYGGRTFTLETNNGMRYRWRCDVRPCRSRLTTDAYGKEHMVYAFRNHDEDVHRREAARKKRRYKATYKQAVTKIGDYGYVLENQVGSQLFWRCEYVSCPGRCRTDQDHRLVVGPSHHLEELHNQGGRPNTVGGFGDASSAVELGQLVSHIPLLPDASESVQSTTRALPLRRQQTVVQEKCQHTIQPREEHEEAQEHRREDRTRSTATVQEKPASEPDPPPPLPPADVDTADKDVEKHRSGTGHSASASGQTSNGSPTSQAKSRLNCPSQPAAQPSEVSAAAHGTVCIDLSDSEEEDMDEAEDKNSVVDADFGGAYEKSSYKSTDSFLFDESNVTSSGRMMLPAEVLGMTCSVECDSRERDLRVAVFDQMRRLLEAETDLAREKLQTEVVRASLLRRHLGSFVVKKEPA